MSIMRLSLSYWGNFQRDWHAELYFGLVYNENNFFVFVIFSKYCHSFDSLLVYFDIVKSQKIWIKMHWKKFLVSQWSMSVSLPSPTLPSLFLVRCSLSFAIYAVIKLTNFGHRNFIRSKTFEHVFSVSNPAEGLGGITRLLEALGSSTSTSILFCTLR